METAFKKHETSSTIEIGGRQFVINSYDPMTGNYILMQVISNVLPMGLGSMLNNELPAGSEKIPTMESGAKMMSKEEFIQLQVDILSTVEEYFPASGQKSPVVRANRTYGVENVSMLMITKLLIASLAFNFRDFFAEFPSLAKFISKKDTNPAGTKT